MSRFTKVVVIVCNLVALWLLARLVSRGVPPILIPSAVAFAVFLAAALFFGDLATSLVLSTVYFVPALCLVWLNNFLFSYYAIWLGALCGAMLPRSIGSRWAFPGRFAWPLILWALVLALSWPIVVLRELDFVPGLLQPANFSIARLAHAPGAVIVWILSVASIATSGLLLLDWFFLAYPADQPPDGKGVTRFERRVIWPVFGAAAIAGAIAVYQMLVDMSFPRVTFYGRHGRAVGTMTDANALGMILAVWVPVGIAFALRPAAATRRSTSLLVLLAIVLCLGNWASGSRTALLTAVVGIGFLIAHIWRTLNRRQILIGSGAAVLILVAALLIPSSASGPLRRIRVFVPSLSSESLQFAAYQLWSRDQYGDAAMHMIEEHPLVGIGVGGFNYQYRDALRVLFGSTRPPDNAQNWYRHQLAELGLLGSIGWIVWTGMFIGVLARPSGPSDSRYLVGAVKGGLVGFAAASLLGVPAQDPAAAITFIVLTCWCLKLTQGDHIAASTNPVRPNRSEWAAILAVLFCFLGGTAYAAWTELRPPLRALRIEFPYRYGFTPDPNDPQFRWTGAKAVEIVPKEKRWLRLVVGAVAPDAAKDPVEVKVRLDRQLIFRVNRHSNFPITRWIRLPDDRKYVMIEIEASRTWRTADFGMGDDRRKRGVAVGNWVFADEDPPKGSVTLE